MRAKAIDGIVVKVTDKNIVLLCDNGTFKNIPHNSDQLPLLGQSFSYVEKKRSIFDLLKLASVAAILILTTLAYTFSPFGDKDSAYIVAMDMNPSIEITMDKNLNVRDLRGVNSDGEQVIESIDISKSNQHISTVMQRIIQAASEKGYLQSPDEALISITVIPLHEGLKSIVVAIEEEIDLSLKNNSIKSNISATVGNQELYKEAKELDISVNQLPLYKELFTRGIVQSPQEVRKKSIPQLKEMGRQKQPLPNNANVDPKKGTRDDLPAPGRDNNPSDDQDRPDSIPETNGKMRSQNSRQD